MSSIVTCGKCHAQFKAKDELAGKQVKCPKCSNVLMIPVAAPAASVPQSSLAQLLDEELPCPTSGAATKRLSPTIAAPRKRPSPKKFRLALPPSMPRWVFITSVAIASTAWIVLIISIAAARATGVTGIEKHVWIPIVGWPAMYVVILLYCLYVFPWLVAHGLWSENEFQQLISFYGAMLLVPSAVLIGGIGFFVNKVVLGN